MIIPPWETRKRIRVTMTTWLEHVSLTAEKGREDLSKIMPSRSQDMYRIPEGDWRLIYIQASALAAINSTWHLTTAKHINYWVNIVYHIAGPMVPGGKDQLAWNHKHAWGENSEAARTNASVGWWLIDQLGGSSESEPLPGPYPLTEWVGSYITDRFDSWCRLVTKGFDPPDATSAELRSDWVRQHLADIL